MTSWVRGVHVSCLKTVQDTGGYLGPWSIDMTSSVITTQKAEVTMGGRATQRAQGEEGCSREAPALQGS